MARPICFMVMPFGIKSSGLRSVKAPALINFDSLWEKALYPSIFNLGYTPVRADQDLGSKIIDEMLERLALSDLVVADLTIPNANVYYEVGVRHGMRDTGCVLISADWSKPLFDVAQFRQVRYPLTKEVISDEDAKILIELFTDNISQYLGSKTPLHEFTDYPNIDIDKANSFKGFVNELCDFQGKIRAAKIASDADQKILADKIIEEYSSNPNILKVVALEIIYLLRDISAPNQAIEFISSLNSDLKKYPPVVEQYALLLSHTSDELAAVSALTALIDSQGPTTERLGLLGGRCKRLYDSSQSSKDKIKFLNLAINYYMEGMYLDLNEYYCSSNLPRLLRIRNTAGDCELAARVATQILISCEAALSRGNADDWVKPTLLCSAFDSGSLELASDLVVQIEQEGPIDWKLRTLLQDLEKSLEFIDDPYKNQFQGLLFQLQALVDQ
ncbi:MAG: hypothetical protein COA96_16495 [SAR86 cluster bacterium]|uniref:DUF4071 domain-containing protein n=1 Tax=SAR86 cluster bacterium TaxID=2030880 RepID=A0A2A5AHU6_9GAMM|nr:MAG: hypothetical protein COA96_16495 [SAR86 cluster bacterium]